MKRILLACAAACCGLAFAKIPAPVLDDAAKAKAAEAAAKTAWQGKVDAYQLCKAQDRVAAASLKASGKTATATPPCADPGPFVSTLPGAAPVAAAASAAKPAAAKPAEKKKS